MVRRAVRERVTDGMWSWITFSSARVDGGVAQRERVVGREARRAAAGGGGILLAAVGLLFVLCVCVCLGADT
jgi:hypothetical protein